MNPVDSPPRIQIIPTLREAPRTDYKQARKNPPVAPFRSPPPKSNLLNAFSMTESDLLGSASASAVSTDHYLARETNYQLAAEGEYVRPTIYQPTPEGMEILVEEFRERTGLDLRVHDLGESRDRKRSLTENFKSFRKFIANDIRLEEGSRVGVVLMQGQNHAIPVLLAMEKGRRYLFVFDSTSGGYQHEYRDVAKDYGDFRVMLNNGTRQADTQSCITDAYEVLTRALKLPDTCQLVLDKARAKENGENFGVQAAHGNASSPLSDSEPGSLQNAEKERDQEAWGNAGSESSDSGGRPRIGSSSKSDAAQPDNFSIFPMPEELCFTAQNSKFIEIDSQADVNKKYVIDGKSMTLGLELAQSRKFRYPPLFNERGEVRNFEVKRYLYVASLRHKQIIDEFVTRQDLDMLNI